MPLNVISDGCLQSEDISTDVDEQQTSSAITKSIETSFNECKLLNLTDVQSTSCLLNDSFNRLDDSNLEYKDLVSAFLLF